MQNYWGGCSPPSPPGGYGHATSSTIPVADCPPSELAEADVEADADVEIDAIVEGKEEVLELPSAMPITPDTPLFTATMPQSLLFLVSRGIISARNPKKLTSRVKMKNQPNKLTATRQGKQSKNATVAKDNDHKARSPPLP